MDQLHPVRLVALGYLTYVMVGWLLLSLPVARQTEPLPSLDTLFTATSAVSTTGLATLSTGGSFSRIGQIVILLLIQLGGLGYMTFGSFVVLSRSKTLTDRREQVGKTVFSMPEEFRVDKFIRSVIAFTLIIEAAGAAALFGLFRSAGVNDPLWAAVFHSISAFCTAGFSLYDDSFEAFRGNAGVNLVLGGLSYLGAIGFIVFVDLFRCLNGKIRRLTLTSRIILHTTCWLSVAGMLLFFVAEPSIQDLPAHHRLLAAGFQVMTSLTTVGFNTLPIGALSASSLFLILMLMVIGASPSGTGGGLKTTTFTALMGLIHATLRGETRVTFWGKEIPTERLRVAIASIGFYVMSLLLGCYLLALTENQSLDGLIFEATSALGTVGLSTGITPLLSPLGKITVILLMFVGRLGPLVFGIALFLPPRAVEGEVREDLAV